MIFAIVVTFNGLRWIDRCFGSLLNSDVPVDVLVIDNASQDGTVGYLKEHFPKVTIIESHENLGFAKANNIGIRKAIDKGAEYVFLLNQYAWIERDTISELIRTFSMVPETGISVPVQLNGSRSGLDEGFSQYMPYEFVSDAYMHTLKDFYLVPFVNAAAWMVSAECIKRVGGFDTELFFHYGEDDNYCQRVRYHHFSLVLNTHCSFCHDREFRRGNEKEYREKILKLSPFDKENRLYGDINMDFDLKSLIRKQVKSLCYAVITFSRSRIKKHRQTIKQLKKIHHSRANNMAGGLVWL